MKLSQSRLCCQWVMRSAPTSYRCSSRSVHLLRCLLPPHSSPLLLSPSLLSSPLSSTSLPSFNLHRLGGSPCNKCGGGRATSIQRAHFRTPRWRSDQLPSQANQCMWTVTLLTLKPSDRTD